MNDLLIPLLKSLLHSHYCTCWSCDTLTNGLHCVNVTRSATTDLL